MNDQQAGTDGADAQFMRVAMKIADEAEAEGNLPIGAVITLEGRIVAKGGNRIFSPDFHPLAHAEINAIQALDRTFLENRSREMTLYTNVEPCVMCLGAIVIHRIGRVVFGCHDPNRGASYLVNHMDSIYPKDRLPVIDGPVFAEECGTMFARADTAYRKRRDRPI